jgi:hypothetical protein
MNVEIMHAYMHLCDVWIDVQLKRGFASGREIVATKIDPQTLSQGKPEVFQDFD